MKTLRLILPEGQTRLWQAILVERLRGASFSVQIEFRPSPPSRVLDSLLLFERLLYRRKGQLLADRVKIDAKTSSQKPDHVLDLSNAKTPAADSFSVRWQGQRTIAQLATTIAAGELPDVSITRSKKLLATAHPMIDNRFSLARGLEDVLARTISLIVATMERHFEDLPSNNQSSELADVNQNLLLTYVTRTVPHLIREIRRRKTFHFAHWRVGYRFVEGAGVAETGDLSGNDWRVLDDDGNRFYADPFPFTKDGKDYIFVEDYPHATKKAIISVSTIEDGIAGTPKPIIEEPYHLSYPQVFERDGDIWMLPEGSSGKELVLYRAKDFPNEWERHTVLKQDCHLSDATLLEQDGLLWLFATDTQGRGSTSDMLVVLYAERLEGPWAEHPANPIIIDRAAARPGGAFIKTGKKTLLPIQDSTLEYGGGLGLAELTHLSKTEVKLRRPGAIVADEHWPYPKIHTLNRVGSLEVIDGIAQVRKN